MADERPAAAGGVDVRVVLPGTIPGLLRRGAAVVFADGSVGLVYDGPDKDGDWCVIFDIFNPEHVWVPASDVSVDLSTPAGWYTAVAWLTSVTYRGLRAPLAFGWDRGRWTLGGPGALPTSAWLCPMPGQGEPLEALRAACMYEAGLAARTAELRARCEASP